MLGNLPNGIVITLASHYVTNVMNADPETKLGYGQMHHWVHGLRDL